MVIALDGPVGSGKSSVARAVADVLGFTYLDTGAMYRCVALAGAADPRRSPGELAAGARIELGERVRLDGRDVTDAIRTPDVAAAASRVSVDPAVRAALVAKQQRLLEVGDWVAEGRDIGTVVRPDAELKIYLTATPEERAQRRAAEQDADFAATLAQLRERDARDLDRAHSPLRPADDALMLDTTGLSQAEVVEQIVALARERRIPA